jgi:hypothetical protein
VVDSKGNEVLGKDKQKTQVYMRVSRCDSANAGLGLRLPDSGKAQGVLSKIDLSGIDILECMPFSSKPL